MIDLIVLFLFALTLLAIFGLLVLLSIRDALCRIEARLKLMHTHSVTRAF